MTERSSFFCSQNENVPTPSPSARARGRLSANGANHCQRPISKRRCSRASAASSCGICLETVSEQGTLLRRLPCGMLVRSCAHEYCFTCVMTWAERTNTCPMCKERFNAVRRIPKRLRGVGETIEVEHKDPSADSVSDDEGAAAALALSQGEQGSEAESSEAESSEAESSEAESSEAESSEDSLEDGDEGEEGRGLGRGGAERRTAQGYELDGFLVSEGTSEDEEEEEEEEEWQQRSENEISETDTPISVHERPGVQTRSLVRGGARRTRSEAVSFDGDRRRGRTRNRGRARVLADERDAAAVGTARHEGSRRFERENSGRMGSRGTEHGIGSNELRQLLLESARLLGASPLRPRRRPPPPWRLSARPGLRSATRADTSSRNFGVINRDADGGNSSRDEPGTRAGDDRGGETRGAGSLNREEERDEVVTSFEDARSTSRRSADEGRGSSVAFSSSESDAGGGLKRAHDGGMIEEEGEEEEHQQEEVIGTGIPIQDRLAAREVVGCRGRRSPSTAVTLRSASSHQAVQSCGDDDTSERKPPTVAGLPRGPSVNEREAPFLAQARRSVAEPSWSPWLSARSNRGPPLRRSFARASSSAQGRLRAVSVRGGGASRNITAAQGDPSAAVAAKSTNNSTAGGRRSGRSTRSLSLHETEKENEETYWGARGNLSWARRGRSGRSGGGSSHPHQAQIEEKEEEEELEWQVGDAPSVAQGGGSQKGRGHLKEERERCRERRSTPASALGFEGFDPDEQGSGGIYSRGRGASRPPPRPSSSSSLSGQDEGLRARLLRRRETGPTRLRGHSTRSCEGGGNSFGSDGSSSGAKGGHEWPKRCTDDKEHRSMSGSDVGYDADVVGDEEAAVGKGRVEGKRTPLTRGRRDRGRASGGDRSRGGTSSGTSTQATIEGFLDQFRFNEPSL